MVALKSELTEMHEGQDTSLLCLQSASTAAHSSVLIIRLKIGTVSKFWRERHQTFTHQQRAHTILNHMLHVRTLHSVNVSTGLTNFKLHPDGRPRASPGRVDLGKPCFTCARRSLLPL